MDDPDNDQRLLKVPPHVVSDIKRDERDRIMAVVIQYWINWTNDDRCTEDYCTECTIFMNILRRIDEKEDTQG